VHVDWDTTVSLRERREVSLRERRESFSERKKREKRGKEEEEKEEEDLTLLMQGMELGRIKMRKKLQLMQEV